MCPICLKLCVFICDFSHSHVQLFTQSSQRLPTITRFQLQVLIMNKRSTKIFALSMRQFSPVTFYRLTVQYHVLEHPKPVHLAHTVYCCLVNETVQSSDILPSDSTVPRSGTSQTSASCPHSLLLPWQWDSSVQWHFTVWQYSTTFWNIPNQCILPTQFTVALSMSQFSPVPFYRLTVQCHVLEHPKPVHLAHTVYCCLVNETVQSSPILPSDSTVPRSGSSQTSPSCPHSLLLIPDGLSIRPEKDVTNTGSSFSM